MEEFTKQIQDLRTWHDLGTLTVAIAHGKALPSGADKLDDNPVNCVSVLRRHRDEALAVIRAMKCLGMIPKSIAEQVDDMLLRQ